MNCEWCNGKIGEPDKYPEPVGATVKGKRYSLCEDCFHLLVTNGSDQLDVNGEFYKRRGKIVFI